MAAWRSTTEWKTPRLTTPGQSGEEALDRVEPRARGRREVEGEALMAVEPGTHLGVFASGVVVEDDVDGFAGRHFGVDGVEEADELLVAVALHVASAAGGLPSDERAAERLGLILRARSGTQSRSSSPAIAQCRCR